MKEFKIRGSAGGNIVTSPKADLPSKGTQTYLKKWLKEQIYGKGPEVNSKYLIKGLEMEDASIELVQKELYFDLVDLEKNEEYFEDEYFCGTPDVILEDHLIDVKSSYSGDTFPIFEDEVVDKGYYWQAQIYMHLTGRKKYKLIYCLVDTPDDLIEKDAKSECYKRGEKYSKKKFNEMKERCTYSGVDSKYLTKVFNINYNEEDIELLKTQVDKCRTYINNLKEKIGYES
jgi:hypothetical protein